MVSSTILVTGLPDGTTKHDLMIYFQSERNSGGSDVRKVSDIDRGQATITFDSAEGVYIMECNFYTNTMFTMYEVTLLPA